MDKLEVRLLLICLKKLGENQVHDITHFFNGISITNEEKVAWLNSIKDCEYISFKPQFFENEYADTFDENNKKCFILWAKIMPNGDKYLNDIEDRKRSKLNYKFGIVTIIITLGIAFITWWLDGKFHIFQRRQISASQKLKPVAKSKAKNNIDTSKKNSNHGKLLKDTILLKLKGP